MSEIDHFELWLAPQLNREFVASLIARMAVSTVSPRQYFTAELPTGGPVWVKCVAASRHRFEPWSSINILPRLRPRFAAAEGAAYLAFANAGIATPALYAFGEEWRFGLRGRGIVVVEWLPDITLASLLEQPAEALAAANRWFALLAAIHSSGWVHGDADSDNFLLRGEALVAIDLEKSQRHTSKLLRKELARATRCLAEHGLNAGQQQQALATYHQTLRPVHLPD